MKWHKQRQRDRRQREGQQDGTGQGSAAAAAGGGGGTVTATAGDSAAAMMVAGTATPLGAAAVARTTQKPISSHPLYDVDDEGHHTLSLISNCRAQPNCVRGRAAAPTFRKPSITAATLASPSENVSPSAAVTAAAGVTAAAAAAAAGVPVGGSRGRDSGGGSGREGKGPDVDSLLFDLD